MSPLYDPYTRTDKELPERMKHDFYVTPSGMVRAIYDLIGVKGILEPDINVLDIGAGTGVWGQVLREVNPNAFIEGVEIQDLPSPPAYDNWVIQDIRDYNPSPVTFDFVIMNPPFKLAEECFWKAVDLLNPDVDSRIVMLQRTEFLNSQGRYKRIYSQFPPFVTHISARRPSFYGNGKTNTLDYAVYVWSSALSGAVPPHLDWFMWNHK